MKKLILYFFTILGLTACVNSGKSDSNKNYGEKNNSLILESLRHIPYSDSHAAHSSHYSHYSHYSSR